MRLVRWRRLRGRRRRRSPRDRRGGCAAVRSGTVRCRRSTSARSRIYCAAHLLCRDARSRDHLAVEPTIDPALADRTHRELFVPSACPASAPGASSGASMRRATSAATGTPPRGSPSTTGWTNDRSKSRPPSASPASRLSQEPGHPAPPASFRRTRWRARRQPVLFTLLASGRARPAVRSRTHGCRAGRARARSRSASLLRSAGAGPSSQFR